MHFFYFKGSRTPLLSLTRRMHLLNFLRGGFIPEGGAVALIQFSPIELQLYRGTMFSVVRRPLERERWVFGTAAPVLKWGYYLHSNSLVLRGFRSYHQPEF